MKPLNKVEKISKPEGPVVQVIMDGVGLAPPVPGNAVAAANTPNLDFFMNNFPNLAINAHGKAVGLPSNKDMGNSEVGHNALAAGRVFAQGAKLVNKALENGSLINGSTFQKMVENCLTNKSTLHFIGLLSDGNVHSHIDHLFKLIKGAIANKVTKIRVHCLLDGRDVPEKSALKYIAQLEDFLTQQEKSTEIDAKIASGGGRMIVTMDRYEADWDIVKKGWDAHVSGKARTFKNAKEAIQTMYEEDPDITDQFLDSFVVVDNKGKPLGTIDDGDSVIFFNFRGDRAIEISKAFEQKDFEHFDRDKYPDVIYAGMMEYDGDFNIPSNYLITPPNITETLSEYLAESGISQFAISETQKFGHVTYFWNGNRSGKFNEKLEDYQEIPSDKVPFQLRPWMKSAQITDNLLKAVKSGKYDYLRVNYANGDMVGHTGFFHSAVLAVESVDLALGRLWKVIKQMDGILIVTADHGNSDEMFTLKNGGIVKDESGKIIPLTSHTLAKVPYIVCDPLNRYRISSTTENPGLANNAATIMNLLGFEKPDNYLPSLLELKQ
ncbi:MAG: 2,3-bisphosphoglycerate-independent phosphoglycerate mutase [Deltaproteobacteria bacterium]|jgi:2,3-bisphosphoglycerate-independent phosphoglycerate mutase|nr:2,3-bisphosphoglycerate-independent phosphoglycerate mutase [Deltaproteobacteria bacterium]